MFDVWNVQHLTDNVNSAIYLSEVEWNREETFLNSGNKLNYNLIILKFAPFSKIMFCEIKKQTICL